MKVFAFAASLRKDSFNKKLIQNVSDILKKNGHTVDLAEYKEFNVPLYDGDLEAKDGLPQGAQEFKQRLENSEALIISSPEYNFSVPGTLKNLVDWVSRPKPISWRNKNIFLVSASPSLVGGVRGLWHLRVPLEGCGAFVYPDMFSLASADKAFAPDGKLSESSQSERLEKMIGGFLKSASALNASR